MAAMNMKQEKFSTKCSTRGTSDPYI